MEEKTGRKNRRIPLPPVLLGPPKRRTNIPAASSQASTGPTQEVRDRTTAGGTHAALITDEAVPRTTDIEQQPQVLKMTHVFPVYLAINALYPRQGTLFFFPLPPYLCFLQALGTRRLLCRPWYLLALCHLTLSTLYDFNFLMPVLAVFYNN